MNESFGKALNDIANSDRKIWLVYYKSANIMHSLRLQTRHPNTACIKQMQCADPYESFAGYDERARSCGVNINPRDVVVICGKPTGTVSTRGVPEFRMRYADAIPVVGPYVIRTNTGAWRVKGRSTKTYRTRELAMVAYDREVARIRRVMST